MKLLKLTKTEAPQPDPELGDVLARIATASSVIRTRAEEVDRSTRNGGSSRDVLDRYAAAAADLEQVAAVMEGSLS